MAAQETGEGWEYQLREACAELDRRLRNGEGCRAEQFFASSPQIACEEEQAVELIYTEYVVREELGRRPTPEEFILRFPQWKDRLERQLRVHHLLRESPVGETAIEGIVPPLTNAWQQLGNHQLIEEIARGGTGIVFRAWQRGLERAIAIKALRPELARDGRARRRFCHEARVMASMRHRHIMPVHEVGEGHGTIWFSMDLARGSLAKLTPAPPCVAAGVLTGVARALQYGHEEGIVHSDLKPGNILLDAEGEPLVSDYGLARLAADDPGPPHLAGTPAYMAPEQLCGEPATAASDIWALGVILHELLSGARPFLAATLPELRRRVCHSVPAVAPGIPAGMQAIVSRCLARKPADRYASAEAFAEALGRWEQT